MIFKKIQLYIETFYFLPLIDYNLFCMKYIFPWFLMFLPIACTPPLAPDYNNFPFLEMDIEHFQEGYTQGDFTIAEVTQAYLDRIVAIDKKGPVLNSFLQLIPTQFVLPNHWIKNVPMEIFVALCMNPHCTKR